MMVLQIVRYYSSCLTTELKLHSDSHQDHCSPFLFCLVDLDQVWGQVQRVFIWQPLSVANAFFTSNRSSIPAEVHFVPVYPTRVMDFHWQRISGRELCWVWEDSERKIQNVFRNCIFNACKPLCGSLVIKRKVLWGFTPINLNFSSRERGHETSFNFRRITKVGIIFPSSYVSKDVFFSSWVGKSKYHNINCQTIRCSVAYSCQFHWR